MATPKKHAGNAAKWELGGSLAKATDRHMTKAAENGGPVDRPHALSCMQRQTARAVGA